MPKIKPKLKSKTPKMPRLGFFQAILIRKKTYAEQLLIAAQKYGSMVLMVRFMKIYSISSTNAIRRITKDNINGYDKFFPIYNRLGQMLGQGLLILVGKQWWHRRKLLQPFFTHKQMPDLAAIASEKTEDLVRRWRGFAKTKEPVSLADEMLILVLQVSVKLLFSHDLNSKNALNLARCFSRAHYSVTRAFSMRIWLPSIHQWRTRYYKAKINRFIKKLIAQRKVETNPPQDFLQTLLTAIDDYTGKPLTEQMIYDEVRTFLGTGHETTGMALTWSMVLLGQHPEILQKLQSELDSSALNNGIGLSLKDLDNLPYNKKVFQETLRLYPPIWTVARRAIESDNLEGYEVPKNSVLYISPYVIHRLEEYWPDPEIFDPERFSPEKIKERDKLAYIPFGVGPHSCIANVLSMIQGQIAQAMLMSAFDFELLSDDFSMGLLCTLKPKHPVYIRLTERKK